jgi:segregation and condensation protein A
MESYKVKIQQFEGPFDLLLFFIQRDELDIYDIDISKITDDFLAYIKELEQLNIDVASEFILVAATLMRIKARLLLPRKEVNEEGEEIDPREELTAMLLEYKRYKDVIDDFKSMEEQRSKQEKRGNISKELKQIATKALVDIELESLTLFNLLKAFTGVMERFEKEKNKVVHTIVKFNYTIENQRKHIFQQIKVKDRAHFDFVFEGLENRTHAIVTFLALMDLLNMQMVRLMEGEGINNFWLTLA